MTVDLTQRLFSARHKVPLEDIMMLPVFFAVIALASATEYRSPYYVNAGISNQYRTQDGSGSYRFGYEESHPSGGTFRDESGDAWGNKYGSYGLQEADGRFRVVNYVADSQGFRAEIKSNEPGLAPQTKTAQEPVQVTVQEPVKEPVKVTTIKTAQKPILYAAQPAPVTYSHPYNPEYPLLYHNPYYASYGNYGTYKGTPFRNYGPNYKGSPYIKKSYPQVIRHGYYVYP